MRTSLQIARRIALVAGYHAGIVRGVDGRAAAAAPAEPGGAAITYVRSGAAGDARTAAG